jgi:malonyl-CoA/methylmalonyl-CoA synthetase
MFYAVNVRNHEHYVQALCFLHTCVFAGELLHAVSVSKPRIIFCSEKAQECVDEVSRQVGFLKEIVTFGLPISHKHTPFISFLQNKSCSFQPLDFKDLNLTVAILSSSGTTGQPKGVMLTQLNIFTVLDSLG